MFISEAYAQAAGAGRLQSLAWPRWGAAATASYGIEGHTTDGQGSGHAIGGAVASVRGRGVGSACQGKARDTSDGQRRAVQEPGHVAGGDAAAGEASAACAATDEPGPEHGAGGVDGERAAAAEGQGDLHSDRVSLDAEEVGGGVRDMARPSTGAGDASWL